MRGVNFAEEALVWSWELDVRGMVEFGGGRVEAFTSVAEASGKGLVPTRECHMHS